MKQFPTPYWIITILILTSAFFGIVNLWICKPVEKESKLLTLTPEIIKLTETVELKHRTWNEWKVKLRTY